MNASVAVSPGLPGARPDFVFERPTWARGTVMVDDARFLHDLVLEARPPMALELGVASGCSSLVLLKALAAIAADQNDVLLEAFDVEDRCYFDRRHATGAAVAAFAPDLAPRYRLTHGDALTARQMLPPHSVHFAFVDANHFHPWPVLDLLALLPLLAPAAWVVLHDVRLPALQARSLRGHGPAHLFDAWPFDKRLGGYRDNTGVLRMPASTTNLHEVWTRVLDQPWECSPPARVLDALGVTPREVAVREMRMLRAIETAVRADRPLCVWGTGQAARQLAMSLRARGVEPRALVERDHTRHAARIEGLPVVAPEAIRAMTDPPLVLVTGMFRQAIEKQLVVEGWHRGTDFVVF